MERKNFMFHTFITSIFRKVISEVRKQNLWNGRYQLSSTIIFLFITLVWNFALSAEKSLNSICSTLSIDLPNDSESNLHAFCKGNFFFVASYWNEFVSVANVIYRLQVKFLVIRQMCLLGRPEKSFKSIFFHLNFLFVLYCKTLQFYIIICSIQWMRVYNFNEDIQLVWYNMNRCQVYTFVSNKCRLYRKDTWFKEQSNEEEEEEIDTGKDTSKWYRTRKCGQKKLNGKGEKNWLHKR